jgi:hypothetical protein
MMLCVQVLDGLFRPKMITTSLLFFSFLFFFYLFSQRGCQREVQNCRGKNGKRVLACPYQVVVVVEKKKKKKTHSTFSFFLLAGGLCVKTREFRKFGHANDLMVGILKYPGIPPKKNAPQMTQLP